MYLSAALTLAVPGRRRTTRAVSSSLTRGLHAIELGDQVTQASGRGRFRHGGYEPAAL